MSSKNPDTRTRILQAAREVFEEGGYDAGLGVIGRRAGVSRQAVYLHFASKAELLTELVTWVEEQAGLGELLAPVWAAESGEQALEHLITAGAVFEPQIHRLARASLAARLRDPTIDALSRDRMNTRFEGMREVVARIEAEGRLAPGWDVDTATGFVWALVAPTTFELLVMDRGWTPQQWAESTLRLIRDAVIRRDC